MPIYEYACEKCKGEFEVEQRITDDPVKSCPSCRSRKVKRLISQTSFVLKGSGWYSDLYGSPKDGKAAAKDGESKEAASKTPSEKSDSKSDAKPDSKPKGKGKGKAKGAKAAA
jgi:putative FmdB family regulatory protein